jgi:hypothetical protein
MKEYFKLQLRILNRHLIEFGVNPGLVYVVVVFLFYHLSIKLFNEITYAPIVYTFISISFIVKIAEEDKVKFLKSVFTKEVFLKIRFIENIFISIPFLAFLLFYKEFLFSVILFSISLLFVFINFNRKSNFTIKTPFYKHPFEFCVGFRKTFLVNIFAFFLCFMAIKVNNLGLGIFSFLLIQLTCLLFYTEPENSYFVWIYSMNAKEFIRYKFRIIVLYSSILCLPIIISLLIFFPTEYALIIGILCLSYLFILTAMLAKYAAFPDKITIREGVILAFLAWFPPILILVIPYLYFESVKKLNTILK